MSLLKSRVDDNGFNNFKDLPQHAVQTDGYVFCSRYDNTYGRIHSRFLFRTKYD
ncbi:hypothetical protein B4121_3119 [Bacillus paralicheniformis]|uniref:Uncharacterized protein n=1 Tax=Bacillus paralicheniformis TaxID=1648923 RepID=A0A7Z1B3L1_9BACI|nr:hypothetical protein B4121_3119 [Bacillus paralicheniformis]